MGGIFGVCSKEDCVTDLFFGTDYHSHLGTRRGGMAVWNGKNFTRAIHNIENSPFRTKFENDITAMKGNAGIGCISDSNPQPVALHSKIGLFAITTVGRINNKQFLTEKLMKECGAHFDDAGEGGVNDTELIAALICSKDNITDGISYAQSVIDGSMSMLVCDGGGIFAARDLLGRTPLSIGRKEGSHCISFESFAYINLGYESCYELGPGEIMYVTADKITQAVPPGEEMRICSFLWTYYGYPTSDYEGVNVEQMRYLCGSSLAGQDNAAVDYVAGVPDSGTAHAIGYSNRSCLPFARPLIKYTPTWPRSFTPRDQSMRNLIARMKLVPVNSLIKNKKLLLIDDSIVRGTQLRGTTDFLYACGAKELHVRSACPPILYGCKYLNFTRNTSDNDLIARQVMTEGNNIADYADHNSKQYKNMVDAICKRLNLSTLKYHSLDGLLGSIGIDKCKLCTYCWNGKE